MQIEMSAFSRHDCVSWSPCSDLANSRIPYPVLVEKRERLVVVDQTPRFIRFRRRPARENGPAVDLERVQIGFGNNAPERVAAADEVDNHPDHSSKPVLLHNVVTVNEFLLLAVREASMRTWFRTGRLGSGFSVSARPPRPASRPNCRCITALFGWSLSPCREAPVACKRRRPSP